MATLTENEALARRLAGIALCDLRTARRYVNGEPMKPVVQARLAAAHDTLRALDRESAQVARP